MPPVRCHGHPVRCRCRAIGLLMIKRLLLATILPGRGRNILILSAIQLLLVCALVADRQFQRVSRLAGAAARVFCTALSTSLWLMALIQKAGLTFRLFIATTCGAAGVRVMLGALFLASRSSPHWRVALFWFGRSQPVYSSVANSAEVAHNRHPDPPLRRSGNEPAVSPPAGCAGSADGVAALVLGQRFVLSC